MGQIISSNSFNPAALNLSDLYIVVVPPPTFITGVPTGVVGIVGTASWGPLNSPQLLGSTTDVARVFGGIQAAAVTDSHDLATEAMMAFSQQGQNGNVIQVYGVRVSDGTDAKATATIKDSGGTATGITLTALYSGALGNQITITIAPGTATSTWNVSIVGFSGSIAELFPNIAQGTAGAFWTNLVNALTQGISGIRGPSKLITGAVASSILGPVAGTTTLTGGLDGRSTVTTAQLTGNDTAVPRTGLYSLRSANPPLRAAWIAGFSDSTGFATIQAFCDSEGCQGILTFPTGTTSSAAITSKQTSGIDDYDMIFVKDWVYIFDSVNNVVRLIAPMCVLGGVLASMTPAQSPLNKQVLNILGTERNSPLTGNQPYSNAEAGQLESAGITFITNPVPGGSYFGFRNGRCSSSNPATSPIEYGGMTNFLAHSFNLTMGQFVGQNQSQRVDDPLRASVRNTFNGFLQTLKNAQIIDDFSVTCDLTNNTPTTISQHFMYCNVRVRYMSSVWFFVVSLQGGTTVVTVNNSLGTSLAA